MPSYRHTWPTRCWSIKGLCWVCGRTEQRRPPVSKRYETKVRMVWGGVFWLLLLQQRSKHPREMVITPKAPTSHFLHKYTRPKFDCIAWCIQVAECVSLFFIFVPMPSRVACTRYCYCQYCMVYSIQMRGRKGSRIRSNNRAIILHQGGTMQVGGGVKGWLILAQQPRSKRISC